MSTPHLPRLTRRRFLVATTLASASLPARRGATVGPAPVRLGLVGAGSRGQELMRQFLRVPGVQLVAACDVYPPRFDELAKVVKNPVAAHSDYHALLARRDLDAVVVATPLWLHREHVIAALASGRHVYGEKALGHTLADCDAIVAAVKASRGVFQVGHQYRYAPWYAQTVARIKAGEIGQVTMVEGYWHRNSDWRRPVPRAADGRVDPALERLINWRMYRRFSGGLLAELASHTIDTANWIFDDAPESVVGSGGIDFYKDGRETADNVHVVFRYPKGQTFSFSAITTNAQFGFHQWVFGTKGSVMLTQENATFYREKSLVTPNQWPAKSGAPGRGIDDVTGASYRPGTENPGGLKLDELRRPLSGPEADITYWAARAFCTSVRTGERPLADERAGWRSGVAVVLGNKSIDTGMAVRFRDHVPAGSAP